MTDHDTITGYLDALASDAPTPGGGSVAGLVNALACALAEMVCSLSPAAMEYPEIEAAAKELSVLRADSLDAMTRDEAAYERYIAATRLPKGTTDEKTARRAAMQLALATAADAPLALARVALSALELMVPVAARGNRHVLSDAQIGAMLADVAVRAALINVRVNAALIRDASTAARLHDAAATIEAEAQARLAEVESALDARFS